MTQCSYIQVLDKKFLTQSLLLLFTVFVSFDSVSFAAGFRSLTDFRV